MAAAFGDAANYTHATTGKSLEKNQKVINSFLKLMVYTSHTTVTMPHTNHSCYEFGPYRLNLAQRLLTRDGAIIPLTPKATDILALLVMSAGRVVEKDDLLKEVWADTFVEDANLAQNIFTLRRALGDERAGPKYIETVPRHGYRFIASVKACNGDEQNALEADAEPSANDDNAPPRIVVAVLPFINATDDDSLEYLAEGVTDNIINHLSRVSALRVMSRSAVFRHKRNEFDPQVLGKELGASAVLVGTISARPAGIGSCGARVLIWKARICCKFRMRSRGSCW
jgi:DNA-binding winged helix-turn-helix (wHTH) protein